MATKLNNAARNAIVENLITYKFSPVEKSLIEEYVALATKIVMEYCVIPDGDKYPKDWFDRAERFYILFNNGGCRFEEDFEHGKSNYSIRKNGWTSNVRIGKPVAIKYDSRILELGRNTTLGEAYAELLARVEKHLDDKEEAEQKATAILSKFSTVEKLVKEWPEIEPFVTYQIGESSTTALAVQVPELNKMFGLPAEEEKEQEG